MDVAVCRSTSGLAALREEWTALVGLDPRSTVFQTWEWNDAWWRSYCRTSLKARLNSEAHVVTVRDAGRLVGLMPLWRSRRRKAIRFLGEHVTDYLMPILDPEFGGEASRVLAEHLLRLCAGNAVDLIDIPAGHPFLAALPTEAASEGSTCPRILLPKKSDELLQNISSNLRHSIRKGDRELLQSGRGAYSDADEANWPRALRDFEALYISRAQLKGRRTVVADGCREMFWRFFCASAIPKGMLRLKMLALDGTPACGIMCFAFKGTTSYYAQGMDPRFSALAPGNLTLWRAVEDAIAEGAHTFDFLRGEEEFKARWRPVAYRNVDIHLPA